MARLPSVGFTTLPWLPGVQDWLGAEGRARGEVLESCSTTVAWTRDQTLYSSLVKCRQYSWAGGWGWGGEGGGRHMEAQQGELGLC